MAINDQEEAPNVTLEFTENSYLTYMLPHETNINLNRAFKDVEDIQVAFESIEQRQSLFFDETVDVLLILRTPLTDEKLLRSYLSRLIVSLETQIVNRHAAERDAPPAADVIYEGSVGNAKEAFIVAGDADDSDGEDDRGQHSYAFWKLPVFVARPRIRLQSPSAVFRAFASMKPEGSLDTLGRKSGYLQSGQPSGLNLLESFGNDPALGGVVPRLSALRVSRVSPVTHAKDMMRHIKALQRLEIKVDPAVHTRVRFSRPSTAPSSPAQIALLEVDFTPHFDCEIFLDTIRLSVTDGTVDNLNNVAGMALPLRCVAHDHVTFLYRLAPRELDIASKSPTRDLDITIEATAHIEPGICVPKLTMSWTTALDFTLPVNPGYGAALQPIQRAHRPSQLSIGGNESLIAPAVSRPDALPALEAATSRTEHTIPDLGITMTFCGPTEPVYAGEVFSWTIYVVNRSVEKAPAAPPRKLALVALPKRRRNDIRILRPPSTSGGLKRSLDVKQVADAVLDENVVHAMQRNSVVDSTDVVCLSADTRVGPLAPGACHVVELKFLALREGIVGVEAIRVVDLGTQEHVDVRELPIMIVSTR